MKQTHLLLLDIDGLRSDVFEETLAANRLPNLNRILGGRKGAEAWYQPLLAPAPSITFCSQASLFTGAHPQEHGIPGNQFFDRFGTTTNNQPVHYAFDIGDTLEVDDAVRVFTDGLAADRLQVPTFYEQMNAYGLQSVVAGNMYATGATWLKPSLVQLGRYMKGGNLFGMSSAEFDGSMVSKALTHIRQKGLPDILTLYFMGVDHDSHKYGPSKQAEALEVVDQLLGEVWDTVLTHARGPILTAIFSDHGQIEVIPEDRHSLKLGFPFDREMASFFDALHLDVHDYPGEAPNCDAVLALNGGSAAVYLHNKMGHWWDPPEFERDVRPIGQAFWEAHQAGRYSEDLQDAIAAVLIRNVEREGWEAPYAALTPTNEIVDLDIWFSKQPQGLYADPVNRINNYTGRFCGDLMLLSNYGDQFYFGKELTGMHGGLHPLDSRGVLAYYWTGIAGSEWLEAKNRISEATSRRQQNENGRDLNVVDLLVGLHAAIGL